MSDKSSIEWTEATWNPVRGCSRVNASCINCYAEKVAARFSGPGLPYEGLVRMSKKDGAPLGWNGVVRPVPEHLADPIRWGRPRRIFVNSMSDLFHEDLSRDWIAAVLAVICMTGHHTHQVLTKRPRRMRELLSSITFEEALDALTRVDPPVPGFSRAQSRAIFDSMVAQGRDPQWAGPLCTPPWAWFGTSVGCQAEAEEFIPHLLEAPTPNVWVSYEPAHGPVDFTSLDFLPPMRDPSPHDPVVRMDALRGHVSGPDERLERHVAWVVVGGESGHGARPFDLAWARSTIAQCKAASVPCFVKQLGRMPLTTEPGAGRAGSTLVTLYGGADRKGGDMSEWPADLRVREFPEARS